MTDPELPITDHIAVQGRALLRAIEALGTIESSGWFEQAIVDLLLAEYKRRLRGIVKAAPMWVNERIMSASELIKEQKVTVWLGEN